MAAAPPTPVTRRPGPPQVYSPYSPATLQLFDVLRNDGFTERQVQSLAEDERLGPVYAKVMVRDRKGQNGATTLCT